MSQQRSAEIRPWDPDPRITMALSIEIVLHNIERKWD